jgi:HEAT repeat protein
MTAFTQNLLIVLALVVGLPALAQSTAPVNADASPTDDIPPLDLTDTIRAQRQLDAMSADQVAKHLTDPKSPEFSWAFQALRKKGEAAIPHLAKLMEREDLGVGWINPPSALLEIGDKSVPTLIDLLQSDNPVARRHAAWALMKRNKSAKDAIKPLIEVVKGKDKEAAGYAAAALAPNGRDALEAVPYLVPLTFDIGSRTHAPIMAVEAIGLDANLIPDVLKQVAADDENSESQALRIELGSRLLAAAGKTGAAALAEAVEHKNLRVRLAATKGIRGIGPEVRTDALEKALNNALVENALRADAAAALVAIGASAKGAVPGLMKELEAGELVALRSMDYEYRSRAAEVLATIPEAGPALIEGLSSDKKIVRIGCLWALVKRANLKEARLHLRPPADTMPAK